MAKIKILTPVHVGTGEKAEAPSFLPIGKKIFYYPYMDVISTIPVEVMTNPNFLQKLAKENASKQLFYSQISTHANYKNIKPLYWAIWNQPDDLGVKKHDFSLQIKDLDRPYIPGSTLKGALEDAWKYAILKENYPQVEKRLPSMLATDRDFSSSREGLLLLLLDDITCEKADEFMKEVFSCLSIPDLYFDQLEMFESVLFNSDPRKTRSEQNSDLAECIAPGQTLEIDDVWKMDLQKLERLKKSPSLSQVQKEILEKLNTEFLFKACKVYLGDVISCDTDNNDVMDLYDDNSQTVGDFIYDLQREIDSAVNDQKVTWLRVGKHTGYFFKTVSWLIKEKSPDLYSRYFDKDFSPVSFKKKNKPTAESMPKTRTLFFNKDHEYLPGFIRVEL